MKSNVLFSFFIPLIIVQIKQGNSNSSDGFDTSIKKFPKLIVFDLNFTLWPFHVSKIGVPPFKRSGNQVVDSEGKVIKLYNDVIPIMEFLKKNNVKLAAASRTKHVEGAKQLCHLLGLDKYLDFKEIYPGQKFPHFENLKKVSGVDYKDMIFFDNEPENVFDISKLGVVCVLAPFGMKKHLVNGGLRQWEEQQDQH